MKLQALAAAVSHFWLFFLNLNYLIQPENNWHQLCSDATTHVIAWSSVPLVSHYCRLKALNNEVEFTYMNSETILTETASEDNYSLYLLSTLRVL